MQLFHGTVLMRKPSGGQRVVSLVRPADSADEAAGAVVRESIAAHPGEVVTGAWAFLVPGWMVDEAARARGMKYPRQRRVK